MISAMRRHGLAMSLMTAAWFLCVSSRASGAETLYGTLISDAKLAALDYRAGVRLATVGLSWGRYMPQKDRVDETYVTEVRSRIKAFTDTGMRVILDLGMHFPPAWIFDIPHSRFVNQYGDAFIITNRPGLNAVNGVFNQAVRDAQALYAARVFSNLGTNFYGVRIGWGHYSELHYAWKGYNGKKNCYWGFDDIAQGGAPGRAAGVKTCPVPGWQPGTPSDRHTNAAQFIEWYLDSLAQYQQFQITTLRKSYPGYLIALYANWGIRTGQIADAVAGDLDGSSFAERFEQTHKGYDFARFIASIQDDRVIVCGTCVNASAPWPATNNMVDDSGNAPAAWSPIRYIAQCAAGHRPPLRVGGENDGNDDAAGMRLSFERVRANNLTFFMWAFDFQLHDKNRRYATIEDYQRHIAEQR